MHRDTASTTAAFTWQCIAGLARRIAARVPERAWDLTARIVNVCWVTWMLGTQFVGLSHLIAERATVDGALLASGVAARLASVMFLCIFVVGVAVRAPRLGKVGGWRPRVVALGGSFLPAFVFLLPRLPESLVINVLSSVLCAVGFGLAAYAFAHLNRSTSIMPEARALVTSGPYRYVRHPAYFFEAIGIAGMFLPFSPLWAVPMYVVQLLCQLQRMKWEERVLASTFPAYAAYAARTPRFIPRFRRARRDAAAARAA